MFKHLTALPLLLIFATLGLAQEADQPLKRAKVGDYVVLKSSIGPATMTMRQEVTEVKGNQVTVRTVSTINGMEQKPVDQSFDVTKKYDPTGMMLNKNIKVTETGTGKETLKINGMDYRCDWRSNSIIATANGMEFKSESKVWISPDAPVFGLVRTVTSTMGQSIVLELVETGNKR